MKTNKLVRCALMTAIVVALTMIVIPLPMANGYVNLGDAGVYAAVAVIGGPWGIVCAALGSMLSDMILGYMIYAPATFIIKGAAAALALLTMKRIRGHWRILGLIGAGLVTAGGYFIYEGFVVCRSFAAALVNLPFNCIQAVIGALVGYALIKVVERLHLSDE